MKVFCSEIEYEELEDYAFIASNGKKYEYVVDITNDSITLRDCIGRYVPIDITSIDQIIDAMLKVRSNMLVPRYPDAFTDMES